jgi:hypothetical protein
MSESPKNDSVKLNVTWLALGLAFGTAIGVALRNLVIGAALGLAFGTCIAIAASTRKK